MKLWRRNKCLRAVKGHGRVLRKIGFKWKKDDPLWGLMELPSAASTRSEFVKSYKCTKEQFLHEFVFLDETWIFQNGTVNCSWQDNNKRSVKTTRVDGKRLFVSIKLILINIMVVEGVRSGLFSAAKLLPNKSHSSNCISWSHGATNVCSIWMSKSTIRNCYPTAMAYGRRMDCWV